MSDSVFSAATVCQSIQQFRASDREVSSDVLSDDIGGIMVGHHINGVEL